MVIVMVVVIRMIEEHIHTFQLLQQGKCGISTLRTRCGIALNIQNEKHDHIFYFTEKAKRKKLIMVT